MIHCNSCQSTEFTTNADYVQCNNCNNKFNIKNKVMYFNPEVGKQTEGFDAERLKTALKSSHHTKHFWFVNRLKFIKSRFYKFINKDSSIIDIGTGIATITSELANEGYKQMNISDIHDTGLIHAVQNENLKGAFQFDIYHAPFKEEFDVVTMFDVLEHLDKDHLVLQNCRNILKKDGSIFITVPAHQWLWNRNDAVQYHKRRYNKKQIINVLENAGFQISYVRYFFIFVTPLLLLRSIINKDHGGPVTEEELKQEFKMNKLINSILDIVTKIEFKIIEFLPNIFGGCLCIVAKKK